MLLVRRITPRMTCFALVIGGMAAVACSRGAPSVTPIATQIATLDEVNSRLGLVDSVALAPDARLVATGERGGHIRVWTTAGESTAVSLGNYRQAILDLAFSPEGRLLASLGRHRESALRLWRPDDRSGPGAWTEAASLPVGRCLALRFDGAGTRLAVLCESEVLIVDVASMQEILRVPNPHREVLTAFDLSADGRRLITAGHDGEVTVRDAVTTTPVRSFSVSRSRRPFAPPPGLGPPEVWAVVVALSSDGSRAAAVTIEGTVYVWDVATGKQLFDHADGEAGGPPPGSLRFGADAGLLTTLGDRYGMRHIDVSSKASKVLNSAPKAYGIVAITDNATAFAAVTTSAVGGGVSYAVEVWRVAAVTSARSERVAPVVEAPHLEPVRTAALGVRRP
jgi:WD40 repeat protein